MSLVKGLMATTFQDIGNGQNTPKRSSEILRLCRRLKALGYLLCLELGRSGRRACFTELHAIQQRQPTGMARIQWGMSSPSCLAPSLRNSDMHAPPKSTQVLRKGMFYRLQQGLRGKKSKVPDWRAWKGVLRSMGSRYGVAACKGKFLLTPEVIRSFSQYKSGAPSHLRILRLFGDGFACGPLSVLWVLPTS